MKNVFRKTDNQEINNKRQAENTNEMCQEKQK